MKKPLKYIALFTVVLFLSVPGFVRSAGAQQEPVQGFRSTELPIPRFVSLKSSKVYVRAGPAQRYPIKWIYKKKNLPIEIIQEFENWRKIRDFAGVEGWIHRTLLSGVRTVLIISDDLVYLRQSRDSESRLVAQIEPNVVAVLEECTVEWCKVDAHDYRGWVQRKYLYGIYEDENFN